MPTPVLRVLRLDPRAELPRYHSGQAAGLDLAACLPEGQPALTIEPGRIAMVRTGVAVAIPEGYEGQVRPRSGLASRHGVTLPNSPGTIDADYRGEVMVPLINHGREPFTIEHGMRIAQMVVAPVTHVEVRTVESLDGTERGTGGFGSTGVSAPAR
ncbi:MAG: dUTP diphosphatase [Phycisphaerales bacterium]